MLARELKRDLKDMTRCKEFYFAMLMSTALIFGSLFFSLFSFYKKDVAYLNPAYIYWGPGGTGFSWSDGMTPVMMPNSTVNCMFVMMVLPFLSALAYSYHYFDDRKNRIAAVVIPRVGRKNYYFANSITSFLGAFIIVLIPLVLEQVVLLICCPTSTPYMIADNPNNDTYLHLFGNYVSDGFAVFHLAHPYAYNLLFCLIPAIIAGFFGMVSFSLSLWIQKSRFLVLTLPGIVWLAINFVTPSFIGYHYAPEQAVLPFGNLAVFPIDAGILAAISLGLLVLHRHVVKDVVL